MPNTYIPDPFADIARHATDRLVRALETRLEASEEAMSPYGLKVWTAAVRDAEHVVRNLITNTGAGFWDGRVSIEQNADAHMDRLTRALADLAEARKRLQDERGMITQEPQP